MQPETTPPTTTTTTPPPKRDTIVLPYTSFLSTASSIPRWLPISFLAISSAALVVPIVMLRRYKASVRVSHHHGVFLSASDAPPPRRRGAVNLPGIHFSGLPVSQVPSQSRIHLHSDLPPLSPLHHVELSSGSAARRTSIPTVMTLNAMAEEEDNFNAPLYTLKALAIATAVVSACASASVMGIMSYLGVRDTSEFEARMRVWTISNFPVLSERIHRRSEPSDHKALTPLFPPNNTIAASYPHLPEIWPAEVPAPSLTPSPHPSTGASSIDALNALPGDAFNIAEVQARLAEAYERGGFYAWGEAAIRELEAEAKAECVGRATAMSTSQPVGTTKSPTM